MRESIGYTATINIVIIFMVITLAVIAGIISYSKAFRANSKIVNAIEKYEGYNPLTVDEVNIQLAGLNYAVGNSDSCSSTKKGGTLVKMGDEEYKYCIYYHEKDGDDIHYSFGVVTYIELDFSFFGMKLQIPIYTRSRRVYYFNK